MSDLMQAMRDQNNILAQQNELLKQICKFITPVSDFFAALKNFAIFMGWIVGLIAAAIALWQIFVAWIKTH